MSSRYLTALTTGVALSVLTAAAPAYAVLFKSTEDFVSQATIGNIFEIKSSQLALERSKNPEVRAFAEQMIADHTKAGNDMKATLASSKISTKSLPTALDEKHQKIYDELVNTPANEFDEEYIDAQDDAHDETIALFEAYAKDGESTALKKFAGKTLPTLKMHAEHVDKIDDSVDD